MSAHPLLDTDVIIRLLTGDDPAKQAAAQVLFEQIEQGQLTVRAPHTVIADAVYVLSSRRLYHLPHSEVAALLLPLVALPHLRIANRRALLQALHLYGAHAKLDFSDALLIALAQQSDGGLIYSYDTDYDGIAGVTRKEP